MTKRAGEYREPVWFKDGFGYQVVSMTRWGDEPPWSAKERRVKMNRGYVKVLYRGDLLGPRRVLDRALTIKRAREIIRDYREGKRRCLDCG